MNTKHLIIVNTEQLRNTNGNPKLEPQFSEEFNNAFSDYVRKLTDISNRCWSDCISNITDKHDCLEARQLIQSTALSSKFSDFAYTYFTLQDMMKKV